MASRGGVPEVMGRWVADPEALRYAMGRAGVGTWAALARASRMSENTVQRIGTGATTRPSAAAMCAIASALGCDVMDLMREAGR